MFSFLMASSKDKWIADNIKFFRKIGFVASLGKLKDKQLFEHVKHRIAKDAGLTYDNNGAAVIVTDTTRVCVHDLGPGSYMRGLDQWAKISHMEAIPARKL